MTFCATANAIVHAGYEPVFVDCDRATLNIDPDDVRRADHAAHARHPARCTSPAAPATWRRSGSSPREHGLAVVEDARTPSRRPSTAGTAARFGDFGCFSFYVTKNMTTVEGGMVVGRDAGDAPPASRPSRCTA